MKYMKKGRVIFAFVCFLAVFTSCAMIPEENSDVGKDVDRIYTQCEMRYNSLDELLEQADVIISGEVKEIKTDDTKDEYKVQVIETYRGECNEYLDIQNHLMEYETDGNGGIGHTKTDYAVGKTYIFVLQHISNVYEDVYAIMSDAYLPLNNKKACSVLSQNIEIKNIEEYIKRHNFRRAEGSGEKVSIEYIESNNILDIMQQSKYIAQVKIGELLYSSDINDVYSCCITREIKGELTSENNQIIIPFFKNTIASGREYIVALTSDTDDSIIYTLSSKYGVMEAGIGKIEKVMGGIK